MLQALCRGTSSGSRALCRPAPGCRATTRQQEDRCCVQTVRLLLFRFFGQFCQLSKNKNCCAQHSSKQKGLRYFVLLPEVSTRSLTHISPFATISETGVCRAEAPPPLLRYYRACRSSLRGYCQLLDISRAANDPSVFTIMEKAPTLPGN